MFKIENRRINVYMAVTGISILMILEIWTDQKKILQCISSVYI